MKHLFTITWLDGKGSTTGIKRHLLCWLASLCLALPAMADTFEIGDLRFTVTDETERTVSVKAVNERISGSLVIPDTIEYDGRTYSVTSIGGNAFWHCDGLTTVTIPPSVTSIGENAFENCYNLTSVTIPPSVTSIGENAFWNCNGLTTVTIPSSVTTIGVSAFEDCQGLTSVTIPSSVTYIGYMAFGGIGTVYYAGNATGSPWGADRHVKFVDGDFGYADEEKTILVAYFGSDIAVTLPSSVTFIRESAFKGCTGLTSVTIPSSVTYVGESAFENCYNLTGVTIPPSVTSIEKGAFKGCTGLTSVTIPSSVTSIGDRAFYGIDTVYYAGDATGSPWRAKKHFKKDRVDITDLLFTVTDETERTVSVKAVNKHISGSLVIPDTIEYDGRTYSVTTIGVRAFGSCHGLTTVTIPPSITSIGENAFEFCSNLTSVSIPPSVTSIGESAFGGIGTVCYAGNATGSPWGAGRHAKFVDGDFGYADEEKTWLVAYLGSDTAITIPSSVTTIGVSAFEDCHGLTSVTIPSSVTTIGVSAFENCYNLTSVTIPSSVTSIGKNAFCNCRNLTSVTIPSSVTSIRYSAFDGIDTVYYAGNATGSPWGAGRHVKFVDGDFGYADEEKTILVAYFGSDIAVTIPSSVTSIGENAFEFCSNLTSVSIPPSVTSIGKNAFCGCRNLTGVTIPSSVTYIGESAFVGIDTVCYAGNATGSPWGALRHPKFVDGDFGYADEEKTWLVAYLGSDKAITIPSSVTYIGESAFGSCLGLTSVSIPSSVTSIGDRAFFGCLGLTNVTIPSSVTTIGESAFAGCYKLTSVTIPPSVTSIGKYAFKGCMGLTSVTIPSSVTSIGESAFEYCIRLIAVTIPSSVTSIGNYAFYGCYGLTSVTIPSSVTYIGYMAFGYREFDGIDTVYYAGNATGSPWGADRHVKFVDGDFGYADEEKTILVAYFGSDIAVTLPSSVTSIRKSAFKGCTGLTSVTIPSSVTSIGESAFENCYNLTGVTIPPSVTSIEKGAFKGCTGLTSVTIPSSVTYIEEHAFDGCDGLTSVTIPSSVTYIGKLAFYGIDTVYYAGNATGSPWGAGRHVKFVDGDFGYADEEKTILVAYFGSDIAVTIPSSVTSIRGSAFKRMYWSNQRHHPFLRHLH